MMHCVVLEDEKAAKDVLLSYIERVPFLHCFGVYESGMDIPRQELSKADLLFLDIQLPELDGMSFAKSLEQAPQIIVTSAFDKYALDAFDIAVTDYLLKPFSFERFFTAVLRVRNRLRSKNNSKHVHYVYADKTTHKVVTDDILYLKAEVDYVRLVTKNKELLLLDSLKNWKERLRTEGFIQAHRSYLIPVVGITSISSDSLQIGKHKIPIGPSYRSSLIKAFKRIE